MAGITSVQAETNLTKWLAASEAVAAGQSFSYSSGTTSRQLTRADAAEIQSMIEFWDSQCKRLSRGSGTVMRQGVPSGN